MEKLREPVTDVFRRLKLDDGPAAGEVLSAVTIKDAEIQEACPLHECLEWRLSCLYWHQAGLSPFLENSVPYIVNNNGRLSENAAVLLFENLSEAPPDGRGITAVELGAGSGLFARLFLDAFEQICRDQGADFYDRLTYVVSDHSPRTLEHWRELGLFDAHGEHVAPVRLDAVDPAAGDAKALRAPWPARAVFCNYVLDVLPTTIWRRNGTKPEELLVSTRLGTSGPKLEELTPLTLDEIRERIRHGDISDELLPVLPLLEPSVRFGAPREIVRWGEKATAMLDTMKDGDRIAINFGAFDCLHRCASHLDDHGFILVNDYGMPGAPELGNVLPQRFGTTVAIGLNFPLLERCFSDGGLAVSTPEGDQDRSVHTRLLSRREMPRTRGALEMRFSAAVERELDAPLVAAREHVAAGRTGEGLDAYRAALERSPRDWHLLGEIAEFVGLVLRDYASGIQIARRALDLNPWTSAWLWNILGDCLYYLERYRDAHEAFLKAEMVDGKDARTCLNLGHSYACLGQHEAALASVARGLCSDKGAYHSRLLQQQEQILNALAGRRATTQEQLTRRLERLGCG